jgi:hypothetical protein
VRRRGELFGAKFSVLPYDRVTGSYVRANGLVRAKTDFSHFITLHNRNLGSDGLPPAVPEPSTWKLLPGARIEQAALPTERR